MDQTDPIADALADVKAAAETHGIAALAKASGVPYTTIRSLAQRDWSHKNLEAVQALSAGARQLNAAA